MASDLKSDLVSKSYDMGPHVKLMGNPAVASLSQLTDIFHFTHFKTKTLQPTTSQPVVTLDFVPSPHVATHTNYPS